MALFTLSDGNYQPFEISIVLGGAGSMLAPDMPVHFDSVLAALAVEKARQEGDPSPLDRQFDLPLAKAENNEEWCYCASALSIKIHHREGQILTRNNNESMLRLNKALNKPFSKLEPSKGQYKNVYLNQTMIYPELKAYAIGDMDKVDALLQNLKYLGAKRANGHGRVESYQIAEVLMDECHWMNRRMPFPMPDYVPIISTCRPWYADKLAKSLVYTPVTLG